MASFIIDRPSQNRLRLADGDTGFIAPAGGLAVPSGDAIRLLGGTSVLTVLGYLRAEGANSPAIRGRAFDFDLKLGATGMLAAPSPRVATVEISVFDRFALDNAGDITATTGRAMRILAKDDSVTVRIENSGRIAALDGRAIELRPNLGATTIGNDDKITGSEAAILVVQGPAAVQGVTLRNEGTISATEGHAIAIVKAVGADHQIVNRATISAPEGYGLIADGTLDISNGGLIEGGSGAIRATKATGGHAISNDGTIRGGVWLGSGNDQIDNFGSFRGKLSTGAGDDRIVNAAGGTLAGGTLDTGDGADTVASDGSIAMGIRTGRGADSLSLGGSASAVIRTGPGNDTLTASGTISGAILMEDGDDSLTLTGIATGKIYMGAGDDRIVIQGQMLGPVVFLGSGDDTIDTRLGSVGATIMGGGGRDLYLVSNPAIRIVEQAAPSSLDPAADIDEVQADVTYTLGDVFLENLTLIGAGAIDGTGNAAANVLTGNGAANNLAGRDGDDTLFGGTGGDTLLGGAGDDALHGEAGNDRLEGGEGADQLTGGPGNDTLLGEAGQDRIIDAEGVNAIEGGAGADFVDIGLATLGQSVQLGDGDDTVLSGAGGDTISGGLGIDMVSYLRSATGVSVDLAAQTAQGGHAGGDSLTGIEAIEGSRHSDTLSGDAQANLFIAVSGDDRLFGAAGDDMLVSGAGGDLLDGGPGRDMASFRSSFAGVQVDLEAGTASGGHAAGDTVAAVEDLTGSNWADTITGDSAANRLYGGNGDDVLRGAAGDDTLAGGYGDDDMAGGVGADVFVFEDRWGRDSVRAFEDGADLFDFRGDSRVAGLADLLFEIVGADIAITPRLDAEGDALLLIGRANSPITIDADDFLF